MCCSLTWKRSAGKSAVVSKIPWASWLLSASSIHRNAQQMSSNCTIGQAPKFYGETTEIEYEGNVFSSPADVDETETRHEWGLSNWSSLRRRVCHWRNLQPLFLRSEAKCVTFPKDSAHHCHGASCVYCNWKCSFSDMKQIKDRLRNRLLPASMFKLLVIAIEGPPLHEVDFDAVLALWKAMKPRRLLI